MLEILEQLPYVHLVNLLSVKCIILYVSALPDVDIYTLCLSWPGKFTKCDPGALGMTKNMRDATSEDIDQPYNQPS